MRIPFSFRMLFALTITFAIGIPAKLRAAEECALLFKSDEQVLDAAFATPHPAIALAPISARLERALSQLKAAFAGNVQIFQDPARAVETLVKIKEFNAIAMTELKGKSVDAALFVIRPSSTTEQDLSFAIPAVQIMPGKISLLNRIAMALDKLGVRLIYAPEFNYAGQFNGAYSHSESLLFLDPHLCNTKNAYSTLYHEFFHALLSRSPAQSWRNFPLKFTFRANVTGESGSVDYQEHLNFQEIITFAVDLKKGLSASRIYGDRRDRMTIEHVGEITQNIQTFSERILVYSRDLIATLDHRHFEQFVSIDSNTHKAQIKLSTGKSNAPLLNLSSPKSYGSLEIYLPPHLDLTDSRQVKVFLSDEATAARDFAEFTLREITKIWENAGLTRSYHSHADAIFLTMSESTTHSLRTLLNKQIEFIRRGKAR